MASLLQSKTVRQDSVVASWSATFDNATQNGSAIFALATAYDGNFNIMTGLGVNDGGTNTFSSAIQANAGGGNAYHRAGILYVLNAVGKSGHQITLTPTISGSFSGAGSLTIMEFSGVSSSSALDGTAAATGTDTAPASGDVTPTEAGVHLAVLLSRIFAPATVTPGSGWTSLVADGTSFNQYGVQYRTAAAATARNAQWTLSEAPSGGWISVQAAFKDAAAGGGAAPASDLTGGMQELSGGMDG